MKKLAILALIIVASYAIYTGSQKPESKGKKSEQTAEKKSEKKEEAHNYKKITADELKAMMEKDANLFIVDSRSAEYMADGTIIKGAVVKPTSELTKEFLSEKAKTPETAIVFYCSNENCPASMQSANKAAEFGFKNILKYPGGIDDWKAKGYPTEKVEVVVDPAKAVKDAAAAVKNTAEKVKETVKAVKDEVEKEVKKEETK